MSSPHDVSRKQFLVALLTSAAATGLAGSVPPELLAWEGLIPAEPQGGQGALPDLTLDDLKAAQKISGFAFTDEQLQGILSGVRSLSRGVRAAHALPITYEVEPPVKFVPVGMTPNRGKPVFRPTPVRNLKKPATPEDLAFLSVRELGALLRSKQVTSMELTQLYLQRLKAYGDKLLCVVTLLEDKALAAARQADKEIAQGKWRGPLHGVPCGIKDLFATKGDPTTWGSEPHRKQVFEYDAALVEKLHAAGAVIVAKLSLGALAQGDVWFAGRTKNPWNPAQGSSGSSAGSSCATAAGLVAFAIGTETLGSIVSPSHQCRVTGLRPTYGRVSRRGAMAVSWTMDKIGPICRNAEDCALVFSAIHGVDPADGSSVERPFSWDPGLDLKKLKVGFILGQNDDPKDPTLIEKSPHLKLLSSLGVQLRPVRFDPVPDGVNVILGVEAASAFDDFARSPEIELLKNSAWPSTYRSNRFVSGVDYLRAMRGRTLHMRRFEEQLGDLDLFVASGTGGSTLFTTNLTGHPQVLVPYGVDEQGRQRSISLVGRLYDEGTILAVANRMQQALGFHLLRPDLSKL